MKKTHLIALMVLCATVVGAYATSVTLNSVEMDVVVRPDGKADFYESMDWQASGGQMHGFYFQGAAVRPVFNPDQCYADLAGNVRVGLSITDLGSGKYDVVLAGGRAFSGQAMYFLNYGGDLAGPGRMGWTKSTDYGELFYFDWAAEQWDYPMGHRTIRIELPIVVPGEKVEQETLTQAGFRTEPYVNKENGIDAYGAKGSDGKYYLTLRFHQENLPAYQTQRLQFYLNRAAIPMAAGVLVESTSTAPGAGAAAGTTGETAAAVPRASAGPIAASVTLLVLLALVLLLYVLKTRGYGKTLEKVEGIKWAGDNWIPPKLFAGTYTVKGKIAEDLHPVEVALLLEWPLQKVVAIMLEGLKRQGIIDVVKEDPLQITILTARKAEHEYEEMFLQSFDTKGLVLSGLLADFFEKVLAKLQEKIWDCDIDATREYYRKKLEQKEETAQDRAAPYYYYWSSYRFIYWNTAVYSQVHLPHDFTGGYQAFMASASCFKGCFAPPQVTTGGVNACYSACHNACHSACVSGSAH
jgi:hypothetical protein